MDIKTKFFHLYLLFFCIQPGPFTFAEHDGECRCFPHDRCWPSIDEWDSLNKTVNGRLIIPISPVDPCLKEENTDSCRQALENLGKDPFYIQTISGGSETTGKLPK